MKRRTLSEKPIQPKKRVVHRPGPGNSRTITNVGWKAGALVALPTLGRGAIGYLVEGPQVWIGGLGMMPTDNLALKGVYVKVVWDGTIVELPIVAVKLVTN